MEKVEKVSIGGVAFILEEGAYRLLDEYMLKLESFYAEKEGGREILSDIEERIAELLVERHPSGVVITAADVQRIIETLGNVEDICSEESNAAGTDEVKRKTKVARRLYRNPDSKVVAGIFGGLGAYFNIDPTGIRILYVLLSILSFSLGVDGDSPLGAFAPLILYVVFWICIPKAKTVAQRDAMHGRSGGLQDFETRKDEPVSYFRKESGPSHFWKMTGRALSVILGILFFGISLFMMVGSIVAIVFFGYKEPVGIFEYLNYLPLADSLKMMLIVFSVLVAGLPMLGFLYLGVCLIFRTSNRWIGLSMLLLWVVSLIGLAITGAFFGKDLKNAYEDEFSCIGNEDGVKMNLTPVGDTLRIDLAGISKFRQAQMLAARPTVYQLLEVGEEKEIRVYPEILIRRLPDSGVADSLARQTP